MLEQELVDDPIEGGAVAKAVVADIKVDAAEGEEGVVLELGVVLGVEPHAGDAEGGFGFFVFDLLEPVLGLFFAVDVKFHQTFAGLGEGVEVR